VARTTPTDLSPALDKTRTKFIGKHEIRHVRYLVQSLWFVPVLHTAGKTAYNK